jgi:hypothetical protein
MSPRILGWLLAIWVGLAVGMEASIAQGQATEGQKPADQTAEDQTAAAKPTEKLDLYLLVGQSNMAGRGKVEDSDRVVHPRVWTLSKSDEWVPAIDPLHFDKPAAVGVGLGRTFGLEIADAAPDASIGLIPCAVGGSPIDAWTPGTHYPPTNSHPWDDAIRRARRALRDGTLKGILWHQGESDATPELAPSYAAKLDDLIARLRKELDAPDVPFIAGQMGQFAEKPWNDDKRTVDRAHRELPTRVRLTAFVNSDSLGHNGDFVHFDAAAYRELGRRYAAAFLKFSREQ